MFDLIESTFFRRTSPPVCAMRDGGCTVFPQRGRGGNFLNFLFHYFVGIFLKITKTLILLNRRFCTSNFKELNIFLDQLTKKNKLEICFEGNINNIN